MDGGKGGGKGDLWNSRFDWVFLNVGLPYKEKQFSLSVSVPFLMSVPLSRPIIKKPFTFPCPVYFAPIIVLAGKFLCRL